VSAELVRRLFDDFSRADVESAFAKIDQDVEWGEPPDMPDTGGTYRGHAAMVHGFRRFMGAWEELRVDLDAVIEEGDRVVALTHWVGRSRGSGIEVDTRIAQVYEFRDGKVARVRQFRTPGEALAAD
jgi:uncharacterized protein